MVDYIEGLSVPELRAIFESFLAEAMPGQATPDLVSRAWEMFLGKVKEQATIVSRPE